MDKDALLKMADTGRDSALLRLSIGTIYLNEGEAGPAVLHLRKAVELDPDYSAAWKLLGKALLLGNQPEAAEQAWRDGLVVAERRGDMQSVREMTVFLKRIDKSRQRGDG
ncbi:TPR repeat-containing protein [Jeongeupia sp. HS-3]|uniref:tetratricopeptide repeat protein n=1 Tax=Jeongeupia sp. HS-3 TaxID=1009682 RepID=UPI0018A59295|nr:tetratricopeptide repeat protein [Jeongeupia sp. HS-3]BCL74579.1 TPR repeat-containing protein [Jeongeupia sp. HS-3]